MTPFEKAVQAVKDGKITPPSVTVGTNPAPYFRYQLAVHSFNLKIMAGGMKFRSITLSEIKKYYGLKGRSAKDVLRQYEELKEKFLTENGG